MIQVILQASWLYFCKFQRHQPWYPSVSRNAAAQGVQTGVAVCTEYSGALLGPATLFLGGGAVQPSE